MKNVNNDQAYYWEDLKILSEIYIKLQEKKELSCDEENFLKVKVDGNLKKAPVELTKETIQTPTQCVGESGSR